MDDPFWPHQGQHGTPVAVEHWPTLGQSTGVAHPKKPVQPRPSDQEDWRASKLPPPGFAPLQGPSDPSQETTAAATACMASEKHTSFSSDNGLSVTATSTSLQHSSMGQLDSYATSMGVACLSLWWPSDPPMTALSLAILTQPPAVADMNGGRDRAQLAFVIQEVARYAQSSGLHLGDPGEWLRQQPFLQVQSFPSPSNPMVRLDSVELARRVLAAARTAKRTTATQSQSGPHTPGSVQQGGGVGGGGVATWPPTQVPTELWIGHLHPQAQAVAHHVTRVLAQEEGPQAQDSLMEEALRQLSLIARSPTTTVQQLPHGSHAQHPVLELPGPTAPTTPSLAQQPSPSQSTAITAAPVPVVAREPLLRVLLQALVVHAGQGGGQVGALRCAAALHLAAAGPTGPLGPRSLTAIQLALTLQEEELAWAQWCNQQQIHDPNVQVHALLAGAVGFHVIPLLGHQPLSYAVRLDLFDLDNAAAAAATAALPPLQAGAAGALQQVDSLAAAAAAAAAAEAAGLGAAGAGAAGAAGGSAVMGMLGAGGVSGVGGGSRWSVLGAGDFEQPQATSHPSQFSAARSHPSHSSNGSTTQQAVVRAGGALLSPGSGAKTFPEGQGHAAGPPGSLSPATRLEYRLQQVKNWALAVYPGDTIQACTARAAIETLYVSPLHRDHGPHCMAATSLAVALKRRPGLITCRLKEAIGERDSGDQRDAIFIRLAKPPSDSWVKLHMGRLKAAARAAGATTTTTTTADDMITPTPTTPAAPPGSNSARGSPPHTTTDGPFPSSSIPAGAVLPYGAASAARVSATGSAAGGATGERPAVPLHGGVPAAGGAGGAGGGAPGDARAKAAQLRALAEQLYPADVSHRALRLQAVGLLALCRRTPTQGATRSPQDHSMPGPQFGAAMSTAQRTAWAALPMAKRLAYLCADDRYLQVVTTGVGPNSGVRLDVQQLLTDARARGLLDPAPTTPPAPAAPPHHAPPHHVPPYTNGTSSTVTPPTPHQAAALPPPRPAVAPPHSSSAPSYRAAAALPKPEPPPRLALVLTGPVEPASLRALAEAVYPASTPHREAKLHAVWVLAAHAKAKGGDMPNLKMTGPDFGGLMKSGVPSAWSLLSNPKVKSLCHNDPYLCLLSVPNNVAIKLDLAALRAAGRAKEQLRSTSQPGGPLPPPPFGMPPPPCFGSYAADEVPPLGQPLLGQTSFSDPGQASYQAPHHDPAQAPYQAPHHDPAQAPYQAPYHDPAQASYHDPATATEHFNHGTVQSYVDPATGLPVGSLATGTGMLPTTWSGGNAGHLGMTGGHMDGATAGHSRPQQATADPGQGYMGGDGHALVTGTAGKVWLGSVQGDLTPGVQGQEWRQDGMVGQTEAVGSWQSQQQQQQQQQQRGVDSLPPYASPSATPISWYGWQENRPQAPGAPTFTHTEPLAPNTEWYGAGGGTAGLSTYDNGSVAGQAGVYVAGEQQPLPQQLGGQQQPQPQPQQLGGQQQQQEEEEELLRMLMG